MSNLAPFGLFECLHEPTQNRNEVFGHLIQIRLFFPFQIYATEWEVLQGRFTFDDKSHRR